jgi:hypothetical protein
MKFKFAENTNVPELSAVPEGFRTFYEENTEGGYSLSSSPQVVAATSSIDGLNGSLFAARKEKDELKGKVVNLDSLKEYGNTPEEIVGSFQSKLEKVSSAAGDHQIDVDKIKKDFAAQYAQESEASKKRIEALTGQLHTTLVTNTLQTAITNAKGDAELLMPFVSNQVRLVEEDGKTFPVVVDSDGSRRYSTTTGQLMTPPELVNEFKGNPKYKPLFESEAPKGGGTPTSSPAGMMPAPGAKDTRNSIQKIAQGLQKAQHSTGGGGA